MPLLGVESSSVSEFGVAGISAEEESMMPEPLCFLLGLVYSRSKVVVLR